MSDDFEVEIKKFKARIERFLAKEKELAEALKDCIKELNGVCDELKGMKFEASWSEGKVAELRLKVLKAFDDVFLKQSEVEHEKSHLLESYGKLLLEFDKALRFEKEHA